MRAKSWPEGATKTRQYDLLRSRVGQKEPPRLGSTICYGQELARKSHRDSAVRFVTAKRGPERATKTRQYDLLRPRVGQKESPRLGSTICYGQTWTRKSHQNSAVRFVTAKSWPERATKTRQYDLLRPNVGQKEPPKLGSTICYGQKESPRLGSTICYGQTWARKSHQNSAVRFVTAKSWPERVTWARKSHRDSARPPPLHTQHGGQGQGGSVVGGAGAGWQGQAGAGGQGQRRQGQGQEIRGQGGKFVGKAENSLQGGKIRGQGGKFVGKAEKIRGQGGNSWARRKIRGQGG